MAAEFAPEIEANLEDKGSGRERKAYRLNFTLDELRTLMDEADFNLEGYRAKFKKALRSGNVIDEAEGKELLEDFDEILLTVASAVLIVTALDSGYEAGQRAAERSGKKRAIRNGR